jgi:transporter family-2 protein
VSRGLSGFRGQGVRERAAAGKHVTVLVVLLALAAGAVLPLQAGINSQLARLLGSPVSAAAFNSTVGLLAPLAVAVLLVRERPDTGRRASAPWRVWTGGIGGAFFVAANAYVASRLGAVTLMGAVLAGQAVAALLIDRFGLVGYPEAPITPGRLLVVALLVAGIALVRYA